MIETMAPRHRFSFCLCADDYALSPAVSQGILTALEAGRLTATSVMTTRPSWPQAAKALDAFRDTADIGLHLNLTLGTPLSSMPRFAPAQTFPAIGALITAARRGALPEAEIRAEIAAQIRAFIEHFGRPPDFVDGHQHVQVLPLVRHWLFDALESFDLQGKIWLRDSGDQILAVLKRRVEFKKALIVAWFARGFAEAAAARGFATNRGFSGFSSFAARGGYALDFMHYLAAPGARHLIMCHPGYVDEELKSLDPVTVSRTQELAFLTSPEFQICLDRHGARLAPLSKIANA